MTLTQLFLLHGELTVLFLISLPAAEHTCGLCANWCAKGNSEEEYNHDYFSHMAAGQENNFRFFAVHTDLLPLLP